MRYRTQNVLFQFIIICHAAAASAYSGSSFNEIYDVVFAAPYEQLPVYPVAAGLFGPAGDDDRNLLRDAARRTLMAADDLYEFPGGRKLLQANGICFSGTWQITEATQYTGQFATGTHSLVIARASVSLGETGRDHKRAFSMAVKIFPTLDPEKVVSTLNLLTMESVTGRKRKYFLDAVMDNAPPLGGMPEFGSLTTALRIYNDMQAIDAELSPAGANLTYRPVTHLAGPVAHESGSTVSPKWLRLRIKEGTRRIDAGDFRDELNLVRYPEHTLVWLIEAADDNARGKSSAVWLSLGVLRFTGAVTSGACDAKLHFHHPLYE